MGNEEPSRKARKSDPELVQEALAGSEAAFEALVRRYQGLVVARAFAILRDRADAEDAAQDAFIRAFRSLDRLRSGDAFGNWLLRTVANVAKRLASRRRNRPQSLHDGDAVHHQQPARPEVLEAIAALPEPYQQVVHLFYGQGHSCTEIAELLGLRVGSVTARLTRARRLLREMLAGEE